MTVVGEAVRSLAQEAPRAFALAQLASLAVRVEPGLIRRLRRALLPQADVGVEADLWFSPVVESRGAGAIVLHPLAAELLQDELARDERLLAQAAALTADAHRESPPTLRLEERLILLGLRDRADLPERVEAELEPVQRALERRDADAKELARWALRALPRLRPALRDTSAAFALALSASVLLGRPVLRKLPGSIRIEEELGWTIPESLLSRTESKGVTLLQGWVRFGEPGKERHVIDVPCTKPLVVELTWTDGDVTRTRSVEVDGECDIELGDGVTGVTLRTLRGAEYRLEESVARTRAPARSVDWPTSRPSRGGGSGRVYVSYSHRDESFPNAWVSTFCDRLESALRATAPHLNLEIWRDRFDVRRNESFTDDSREALRDADIMICIVSPAYSTSRYCSEELDYFLRARAGARGHLIRVDKRRMPVAQPPEALQEILGHSFFEKRTGDELLPLEGSHVSPAFDRLISPLAREVADLLESARAPRRCVLLLASRDREPERARLAAALEAQGIAVAPSHADPVPSATRAAWAWHAQRIEEADFAVLLVGGEQDAHLQDAFGALEQKWPSGPRRCLVALPPSPPEDPRQRHFLERLDAAGEAFDFVERSDHVLPETQRLLAALDPEQGRIPTLYLAYPKASKSRAQQVREEVRRADEALRDLGERIGSGELRFVDPYGDGDAPQLPTQTLTRDRIIKAMHGAIVLVENEGAFVFNALSDFDYSGKSELRRHVVIAPVTGHANVPESLTQEYRFLQLEGVQRDWLPPRARVISLVDFLRELWERASQA